MKTSSKTIYNIEEANKTIELVAEYPNDEAPKKVTLELPYKNGRLATLDDITNGGNIDLTDYVTQDEKKEIVNNMVTLKGNQIIHGIKVFNDAPRSNHDAVDDDELVRLSQLLDLIKDADFAYTNPEKMSETVGGLVAGTSFDNVKLHDLLTALLYPYREPTVSAMGLSKTEHPCYSFLPNINLSYTINNEKNVKPNTVSIYVNRAEYLTSQPTKGTVSINGQLGLNYFSTAVSTIPVEVRCMSIKDKNVSKSVNLQFVLWCFTGCSDDPDIVVGGDPLSVIENSNFSIKYTNNLRQQFTFPQGGYKYVVFPSTWSNPTKFVDVATQFEVPMDYMGETTFDFAPDGNDGVNPISRLTYKVYRSHNVLGGSITVKIQ